MRRLTTAGLIAGLALAGPLAAPAFAEDPAYDASTVLATVNGTEITLGHAVVLRERLPEQFQNLPDETLMQGIVDQLVDQTLLADTLSTSPETDPREVRLHLENERRGSLASRVVTARIAEAIAEEDIAAAYDEAFADFEPQPEFNASHIIVESEEEAAALKAEIDGGADFAELAREHSMDGAAAGGGELGWFGPGMMVPEFETEVRDMTVGEVRGPVQTQFGWHLIRLNETRLSAPPELAEVREQLVEQVRQERLTTEIEALRAAAAIDRPETGVPAEAIRDATILAD